MCSHWHKEEIILLDFLLLYTLKYFQVLALSATFLLKPEEDAVKTCSVQRPPSGNSKVTVILYLKATQNFGKLSGT